MSDNSDRLSPGELQRIDQKARNDAKDRVDRPPNDRNNGVFFDWRSDKEKVEDKIYEDKLEHYKRNR